MADEEKRPANSEADPPALPVSPGRVATEIGPSYLQLALVIVLVVALMTGPIGLLWAIDPAGPWRLMPLLALTVAAESVLTRKWLTWPARRRGRPAYTMAELAFLLIMTPLFVWIASGEPPRPDSLEALLSKPFSLLSIELVLYALLVIIVWERAHMWSGLFIELSITEDEVRYHTSSSSERSADRSIVLPLKQRSLLLQRFVQGWIVGGTLLIVFAALTTFDVSAAAASLSQPERLRTVARLGLSQEMLIALLVYFVGGLWLISQGRMVILKGRWLADRSHRDAAVIANWRRWSLLLLGVVALAASFMPIGSTIPLYRILQSAAVLIIEIVARLMSFIFRLVYALISLLPEAVAPELPPDTFSTPPAVENLPDVPPSNVPALLAGSLFWLAIIVIAVVATVYFLRDRGPDSGVAELQSMWQRFFGWLLGLGRGAARGIANISIGIPWSALRRSPAGSGRFAPFRYLRISALPPRLRVRFLYLALVRQSGKRGVARTPAATPDEFAHELRARWPEGGDDVDTLTEAFLIARYSEEEIDRHLLARVKDAWFRLRRIMGRQSH